MTIDNKVKGVYFYLSEEIVNWLNQFTIDSDMSKSDIVHLALDYVRINWSPETAQALKARILFLGEEALRND